MATVQLNSDAVRDAYRRQAKFYDLSFGLVSIPARHRTVDMVNSLPGQDVLEVGVGTGLALPHYDPAKQVTGIDLSTDMLEKARARVKSGKLDHVAGLHEMDAEATRFPDASFDIAVAMFVASVVPNPTRLLAEMKRLVRPGGHMLFINHFSAEGGLRLAIERRMAPMAHTLGWHPDFPIEHLLPPADRAGARVMPVPPFGLFTLVHLVR